MSSRKLEAANQVQEKKNYQANQNRIQTARAQQPATLEACLKQLYSSYQNEQWAEVISQCNTIITQCNQKIARSSDPTPPKTSAPPQLAQPVALAELFIAKGDLFSRQGQLTDAITAYEQALSKQPQQPELLKKIDALYRQKAQAAKAEEGAIAAVHIYLKGLQQHPRLFSAYTRLRYNLMRYDIPSGDPVLKEVVRVCQNIVDKEPTLLPAQITLAYALTKLGEQKAATECYRKISAQSTRRQLVEKSAELTQNENISFTQSPSAPDFMIIGAEKCGTTSLYHYLRQHPDVLSPIEKEIDFFDMEYENGIDWYLAHFPSVTQSRSSQPKSGSSNLFASTDSANKRQWLTGETSANYLYSDVAPKRVFQHFPHLKLAVVLRNPIDRTVSRYNMMVRNGAEKRSLNAAVTKEIDIIQSAIAQSDDEQSIPWPVLNRCRHVGNSLYYYHLKRWLDCFTAKQLLVLRSEDLFSTPKQTLAHLYQSFGLKPYAEESYPKHNSGQYTPIDDNTRQILSAFFTPHTHKLETLLGRSFDWEI